MAEDPREKLAYEPPDAERPSSASPTERQLEREVPTAAAPGHDPYAALRLRNFRLLAGGFFITSIGAQMQTVAAQYEIYAKTGSALSLGLLGAVLAVPMLVLALPAGQLADMFSRRRIVLCMLLCNGSCALGLAWLTYRHSGWQHMVTGMYVLLGFGNGAATLGRPARTSLLPQLVPTGTFSNAVTWNSTIFETASMIGPAIGGFICARSVPLTFALASVCWIACFFFVLALPEVKHAAPRGAAKLSDVFVGLRFVWRSRLMLGAMTLDLFAVLFGGATFLFPAVAKEILHVGPTGFGWLRAAPAIGAFTMAMALAHRRPMRRAGRALLLAVAGFGLATIVFGLSRNYALSFAMLVVTGMCDNISVVVRHTVIQLLTPDSMRGRVSAVNQIFIGSSNELGGLESGLTAKWFGLVGSIVIGGIGTLVVVGSAALTWPELRRLGSLRDIKPTDNSDPETKEPSAAPPARAPKA